MNIKTFNQLPTNGPDKKYVGEVFLEGENIVKQKSDKKAGDSITYFVVSKISENSYEYTIEFDVLTD